MRGQGCLSRRCKSPAFGFDGPGWRIGIIKFDRCDAQYFFVFYVHEHWAAVGHIGITSGVITQIDAVLPTGAANLV